MSERVDTPAPLAPPPPPALKHCWVSDGHGRLPGLLLEWRRTESGYQGRVVRPVLEEGLGWVVVEEWVSATLLEPA
ncbi:hypothetical protein [Nocardioides mesophilus]|nr:hypothetical protein [Nocardioides mesophilus]